MLSVVIPTLNDENGLARTLGPLIEPAMRGLVREVIVADGGSTDGTTLVADETGADFLRLPRGRGVQLRGGAESARGPWLLFLYPGTVLAAGWADEAKAFVERCERAGADQAGIFRYAIDDFSRLARRREMFADLRWRLLGLPQGAQGLLISKRFYDSLGGFAPLARLEDVDLLRRIGRNRLSMLRSTAVCTGQAAVHSWRDAAALTLCALGVPARLLGRAEG